MPKELEKNNNNIERTQSHEPILNDTKIIEILHSQENKIIQTSNKLLEELNKSPNLDIVSCYQLFQLGLRLTKENLNGAKSILSEMANKNILEERKQLLLKILLEKLNEIENKTEIYSNIITVKLSNSRYLHNLTNTHLPSIIINSKLNTNNQNLIEWNELSNYYKDPSKWNKNNIILLIKSIYTILETTIKLIDNIQKTLENIISYTKEKLNKLINPNNHYSAITRIIISNELLKKHYKKLLSKDMYIKPNIYCLLC